MEDLGVDVGKSLMTKALLKGCFMRALFKPGIYILVRCMRGVEAGGWNTFFPIPVKCMLFKLGFGRLTKTSNYSSLILLSYLSALEWNKIKGGAV